MKTYIAKTLIPGFRLGVPGKILVSVPMEKFVDKDDTVIIHNGVEIISLKKGAKALFYRKFSDKFGRDNGYTLGYFEVKETSIIL